MMKLFGLTTSLAAAMFMVPAAKATPGPWDQAAASLAEQIAGIVGPGVAELSFRNLSSIPAEEVPAIRALLEQDLKTHGLVASVAESASVIRVTLSQNERERVWVAEVMEGNQTRVVMVTAGSSSIAAAQPDTGLTLRRQTVFATSGPILAALELAGTLVSVEPEEIVIYVHAQDGWREQKRVAIGQKRPLARDPRAVILPAMNGQQFEAWLAGAECTGIKTPAQPADDWSIHCRESDDPWAITAGSIYQGSVTGSAAPMTAQMDVSVTPITAFFNMARNYFTGLTSPSLGVDLPPFYSAAMISHPMGAAALLVTGIDGNVRLVENGAIKPLAGTRDWGSDVAAVHSACGAGTQILSSGSGAATNDSLRAYEVPVLEDISASAPLPMGGTVMNLWSAPDGKSALAVVRQSTGNYEVDRVTALCN